MHKKQQFYPAILSVGYVILAAFNSISAASGTLPPPTKVKYEMQTFTIPGNTFIGPFGPNIEGTVAGFYSDSEGDYHGFVLEHGAVTSVDAPGWDQTIFSGINDWGIVSGDAANDAFTAGVAFLYNLQDGSWSDLPAIPNMDVGGFNVVLNDLGIVAGAGTYADGSTVAWTWDGHSYSFFSAPEADETLGGTQPLGINNRGEIAGLYFDSSGAGHGFIKDGTKFTTVDVPGAIFNYDFSINDEGDLAGSYYVQAASGYEPEQGFIMHDGNFYTFPVPGYGGLTTIDDLGVVCGTYTLDPPGDWTVFVAVPKLF